MNDEEYERSMKMLLDDWSKSTIDVRFIDAEKYVPTPGWDRFKAAVKAHIKWLEENGQ